MANAVTWRITDMERMLDNGYVFKVYWAATLKSDKKDEFDEPITAQILSSVGLSKPDSLIPFDELSESLIISWVKEALGPDVRSVEDSLLKEVDQRAYPSHTKGLPW